MIEITKTRHVQASPDDVFAALTEPDRLRRWLAVATTVELRAGGDFRFMVTPDHVAAGQVEELVPGKRLALTWGWEGETALPPGSSRVVIDLEPVDGGTRVRLHHEALPDGEDGERYAEGWTHYLDRLVVAAAEGDAGPDDWAVGPEDATALDQVSAASASWALTQSLLRDLDDGQRQLPTPCRDYDVTELVDHLGGGLAFLAGTIGLEARPTEDHDLERRVGPLVDALLLAWAARGLDGDVPWFDGTTPATYPADITALELFVHGWDLSRALDRPFSPSAALVTYMDALVHRLVTDDARASGRFDPAVEPAADASALDRVVAWTGRDPR